jgi:flagellar biosynthesis protein FlhB
MRLLKDENGYSNLVPLVLAIVITFALLFVGTYVVGSISQSLEDSYPAATYRTDLQNDTLTTMGTIEDNYDSTLDIVQVVIIITILAGAIAAIFLFTRFN